MRLLVLGGTVFLSRAVVQAALERGHDVVAASRGRSGVVPGGARHVVVDRDDELPVALTREPFDAVVDVSRVPSHVRRAVAAWPDAHWVFVSTINVYADDADPAGPGVGRLREPEPHDVDPASGPDAYGAMKVACERLVLDGVASTAVVRPGLIAGPGDPSGRFAYWPARLRRLLGGADEKAGDDGGTGGDGGAGSNLGGTGGGNDGDGGDVTIEEEVLAPGDPHDLVQMVDVRDLADWVVDLAERRTAGTFDAVGPAAPIGDVLTAVARGCGVEPRWRWVDPARLAELDVRPWSGERSLPLWLPRPEHSGMVAHDAGPALAAGLSPRPVEETARDVLGWLRTTPDAPVTGLTAAEEAEVLAALG